MFAGTAVSGAANFAGIVYLARVLGASAFGLFQFAQAFLLYLVFMVDSGLSSYGTREIAREPARSAPVVLNLFALRLLLALGGFAAALLVLFCAPLGAELRLFFLLTFLLVFYRALNADWVFQGLERMEYIALAKMLFSLLSLAAIVLAVKSSGDLLRVPQIQFAAGLLVSLVFVIVLFRYFLPWRPAELRPRQWGSTFLLSLPLGASLMLMLIYDNLDTIMLGFMDRPAVVGYYNAAYKLFYVCSGLFSLWLGAVFPVVSRRLAVSQEQTVVFLTKYLRLTMLAMLPLTVLVFLSAPLLIRLVFGAQYAGAVPALQILIWSLPPFIVSCTYGSLILQAGGRFHQFFAAAAAGALVNIGFNFLLIPRFSLLGAAASTVLAQAAAGAVAFFFARRVLALPLIRPVLVPLLLSALAALCFAGAYRAAGGLGELPRLCLGGTAFVALYAALALLLERRLIFGFLKEIVRAQ